MIRTRTSTSKMTKISLPLFALILFVTACSPNEGVLRSGTATPPQAEQATQRNTAEAVVEDMRTAAFSFIYVIRRADGGALSKNDIASIRTLTAAANRRELTADGTAVVVGTNAPVVFDALTEGKQRLTVEDMSPQPPPAEKVMPN